MDPHDAAGRGDLDALRQMDPDTLRARCGGITPAHFAAGKGHLEVIQFLHEVVPDALSGRDGMYGMTPAHRVAQAGHLEVIRYLHEVGPDTLWAGDVAGRTPADVAEAYGHQAVADYLSKPWTPLMHAAADRRAADVERLLHQGADPTVSVTHEGRTDTALTLASTKQGEHEVCRATVELIMGALAWSPESHHLFPPAFRRGVPHVLGVMRALNAQRQADGKAHVRGELWHRIIAHLPREWGSSDTPADESRGVQEVQTPEPPPGSKVVDGVTIVPPAAPFGPPGIEEAD